MLFDLRSLIGRGPAFDPASIDELRGMVESIPDEEGVDRRRRLFDLLDQAHQFSVPKGMVDRELSAIWRQLKADRKEEIVDPDDVGKSDDELRAEYRVIAERRVRLGFVLKEIARRNSISVDRDDIAFARANGYRGPNSAIFEEKVVEFIFGLGGANP
jgi:trigger factor